MQLYATTNIILLHSLNLYHMYDIVRVYCVKVCDCVYHIGNINGKLNNIKLCILLCVIAIITVCMHVCIIMIYNNTVYYPIEY